MSSQNQSSVLHKFKDILFSTMSSEELLSSMDSFNAREDYVFLVSYPKSGKVYFNVFCRGTNIMTIIIIINNYYFYKIFVFQNFPQEIEVSQLLILMKKFDSREAKNVL